MLYVHISLPIILYYIVQRSQIEDEITCVAVVHSNSVTTTLNGISISQCLSGVGTGKHRKLVFLHYYGYREFRSFPWGPRHGLRFRSWPWGWKRINNNISDTWNDQSKLFKKNQIQFRVETGLNGNLPVLEYSFLKNRLKTLEKS